MKCKQVLGHNFIARLASEMKGRGADFLVVATFLFGIFEI